MHFGFGNRPDYLAEKRTLLKQKVYSMFNLDGMWIILNQLEIERFHECLWKEMEKPIRWRNDETLLLKCTLCASKARDNIILSMNNDFFSIFPEICHTARMTTTKIMKLLLMIILNQKQQFSLQKKVTSKEWRVETWAKPTKIVNLILRLALPKKNRDVNQIPRKDHT